jgi:hypothetical protein
MSFLDASMNIVLWNKLSFEEMITTLYCLVTHGHESNSAYKYISYKLVEYAFTHVIFPRPCLVSKGVREDPRSMTYSVEWKASTTLPPTT